MVKHAVFFAALLSAGSAAAQITPTGATTFLAFPGYEAAFAIDTGANRFVTDFASASLGAGTSIVFSFGAPETFNTALITDRTTSGGPNGGFVGGTTDFTTRYILTFATDAAFTNVVGSYISPEIATPAQPTTIASFQTTASFDTVTAQFVRYFVASTNGPNPGLADIQFDLVTDVPAPGALGLAGLGVMLLAARRRRA